MSILSIAELQEDKAKVFFACNFILDDADSKALNYAIGYTKELRRMIRHDEPDNAIVMQCRYVLNNITHWRHSNAKHVRSVLKAYCNAK